MQQIPGTTRHNPYLNFKFQVYINKDLIAGVSKVSSLKRTTEVVEHRFGGNNSNSIMCPGRNKYAPITLERGLWGLYHFDRLANKTWNRENNPGSERSGDFRVDLSIVLLNEPGQPVIRYNVHNCWVSEFQAFPDLDANANAIAIQYIKLENEGWTLEQIPEPTEPVFTDPAG